MGLIFYADNGSDRIYKTNIDGSERTVIIGSGLGFPADITIDRFSKKFTGAIETMIALNARTTTETIVVL